MGRNTKVANGAARSLARELDAQFSSVWSPMEPVFAWSASVTEGESSGGIQLGGPFDVPYFGVDLEAFGLTSLTRGFKLGSSEDSCEVVRLSLAVSCCSTAAMLRFASGTVRESVEAKGVVTELLRGWVTLLRCPACLSKLAKTPFCE